MELSLALERQKCHDSSYELQEAREQLEEALEVSASLREKAERYQEDLHRLQGTFINPHELYSRISELEKALQEARTAAVRNDSKERSPQRNTDTSTTENVQALLEQLEAAGATAHQYMEAMELVRRESSMEKEKLQREVKKLTQELEEGRQLMMTLIKS